MVCGQGFLGDRICYVYQNLFTENERHMKKTIFILVVCISIATPLQVLADEFPDYGNGDGTIISMYDQDSRRITIRKTEGEIRVGNLADPSERVIYDSIELKNVIGQLNDNDVIQYLEILRIDYLDETPHSYYGIPGETWLKISFESLIGWIRIGGQYFDPFKNNQWEIIEILNDNGMVWTIRRLDQVVSVHHSYSIYENPHISENQIVYTIRPRETDPSQTNLDVIAITEETVTIDGWTDHWLLIRYGEYTGWIFGGYTTVERGGPKYGIPSSVIPITVGWY
jgi:hypothetical protein